MAHILIAEDDPTYARVLERVLRGAGHAVEITASGQDALVRLYEEPPDLLLLDVIMPGMDGYEVARLAKADARTAMVPIVFITGATDTHHKIQGLESGANDYITKPFHRSELLARISVSLRIRELEDELRRKNEVLADLARTDDLTGLANRRLFDERLREEIARARRYKCALSVLAIDIDHFKQVNDSMLHAGGDRVLCAVARCLRSHMRANDLVARIGGEEFGVLCPETDEHGARTLAERIRAAVATLEGSGEVPLPLTVSVGVATLYAGMEWDAQALSAAADAALYEAKRAGRNRVASTPPP